LQNVNKAVLSFYQFQADLINLAELFMSDKQYKHAMIFETLRGEILNGKYSASRKLPSEAQLVRRFGISRPTISRALRDLKQAGFLDRRPGSGTFLNPSARQNTGLFGMIIPGHGSTEIFTPICSAIAARSQAEGYTLLWNTSPATNAEQLQQQVVRLCRDFIDKNVAGVFLEPLELTADCQIVNQQVLEMLSASKIPVILLDRDIVRFPDRSGYDLVGIDNLSAGYRLANHLIERGASKIIFFAKPNSATTVIRRIAGIQSALFDANLKWNARNVLFGDPESKDDVAQLLKSRADAVICANDMTAAFLLGSLRELRVAVPRDLLLGSFDDAKYAKLLSPALTTIHQPCIQIGETAVQAMLQRIREPQTPPREILLDAPLIVRESTKV
jgi:LacI family transcriptional regulator